MNVTPASPGCLDGIRVLDLTQFEAGTTCTEALAWMGADIAKVENPKGGEAGRTGFGDAYYFMMYNANKRSLTVNLKSERGLALVKEMAKKADVFAENFRPVGCRRPFHQDLRLRQQQRLQPVDLGVQLAGRFARDALRAGGGAARAQQHQDGEHTETDEPEGERQARGILPAEGGDGALRADGMAQRRRQTNGGAGGEPNPPPRTRTQPPVHRPDRLRHAAMPHDLRAASAPPPANRRTLRLRGLAPKESRP